MATKKTLERLHDVLQVAMGVEKVLAPDSEIAYPACTGGGRHGPAEDCGGVYGYYNLLEVLGDPDHHDPDDLRGWVDEDFDPEASP